MVYIRIANTPEPTARRWQAWDQPQPYGKLQVSLAFIARPYPKQNKINHCESQESKLSNWCNIEIIKHFMIQYILRFLKILNFLKSVYECLPACLYICDVWGGQGTRFLRTGVNKQFRADLWVPRTQPRSSERSAKAPNHWAVSLIPVLFLKPQQ